MSASAATEDNHKDSNENNEGDEEDDEESLEKLQEEIARMEEEAARLSKETEDITATTANNKESAGDSTSASTPAVSAAQQQKIDACSVYVGQVDYSATPEELLAHFGPCGTIERVTIVCDKFTGKPKGDYFSFFDFICITSMLIHYILDKAAFIFNFVCFFCLIQGSHIWNLRYSLLISSG